MFTKNEVQRETIRHGFSHAAKANCHLDRTLILSAAKGKGSGEICVFFGSQRDKCWRTSDSPSYPSMEVMRADLELAHREGMNAFCLDVNHSILILQGAFHQNKFAARDHHALPFVKVGSDDDIQDARFVFYGEKDEPLGCARTLTCNDAPGSAHELTILAVVEFTRSQHILLLKFASAITHWMPPKSQTSA
jgi:hypothetical protein